MLHSEYSLNQAIKSAIINIDLRLTILIESDDPRWIVQRFELLELRHRFSDFNSIFDINNIEFTDVIALREIKTYRSDLLNSFENIQTDEYCNLIGSIKRLESYVQRKALMGGVW